jgi:hypothetical protein
MIASVAVFTIATDTGADITTTAIVTAVWCLFRHFDASV